MVLAVERRSELDAPGWFLMTLPSPDCLTTQITGGKKHSEERAALFAVRVHLPCYVFFASLILDTFEFISFLTTYL